MTSQEPSSTVSRQERRKERTRESLLDAVRSLASEVGPEQMTIADIANRADVGVGTFYNHFSTKEHIVREAADREFRRAADVVAVAADGEVDPAVRIAIGVLASLQGLESRLMWAAVTQRSEADRNESRPLFRSPLVVRMIGDLTAGFDAGAFDIPPGLAGFLVVGCVNSSLTSRSVSILQPDDEHLVAIAALRAIGLSSPKARRATAVAQRRLAAATAS